MAVTQIMHGEREILGRIAIELGALGLGGMRFDRLDAKHERHDPVFAAMRRVRDADSDAIAQNRGAIAERSHLSHAMGNEDYRGAPLAPLPRDREHPFR